MNEHIEELLEMAKKVGLEIPDSVIEDFEGTDAQLFECLIRVINRWVDGEITLTEGDNVINIVRLGKIPKDPGVEE